MFRNFFRVMRIWIYVFYGFTKNSTNKCQWIVPTARINWLSSCRFFYNIFYSRTLVLWSLFHSYFQMTCHLIQKDSGMNKGDFKRKFPYFVNLDLYPDPGGFWNVLDPDPGGFWNVLDPDQKYYNIICTVCTLLQK